jgi:hypothetical protein
MSRSPRSPISFVYINTRARIAHAPANNTNSDIATFSRNSCAGSDSGIPGNKKSGRRKGVVARSNVNSSVTFAGSVGSQPNTMDFRLSIDAELLFMFRHRDSVRRNLAQHLN